MPTLNDMTPDQLAEHFARVASGEAADDFADAYEAACAPAEAVTDEEAAKRELQEIVWVGDVIRFRENILVSNLLGPPHPQNTDPVEPWMKEQFEELKHPETGNAVVRFLLENGPTDMNGLAYQDFPQKDEEQFAMLIGYSVSGAGELSYFSGAMIHRADIIAAQMVAEREA